ncbi:MAG: hypothetical protein OXH65_14140 [Paracoccaceae bacterium]|nr:hypothetical protein [Paracoccaceae bacterium]MDE2676237.1 hypothetical protein [Paracoccaceae bacterium]
MQRDKLFFRVVSITLLLLICFIFWIDWSNTTENTVQSFHDDGNTLTNTLFATEDFDFVAKGKVTLSGSDLCDIESVNLSSLNLEFDNFGIHLNGELKNYSGLPKGALTINLTGDKEKFYELLVTNGRIKKILSKPSSILLGNKIRIIDGKLIFLYLPVVKVIDSFPEFC